MYNGEGLMAQAPVGNVMLHEITQSKEPLGPGNAIVTLADDDLNHHNIYLFYIVNFS